MKTEIQCDRAELSWQVLRVQQNIGTNRGKGRDAGDTKIKGLRRTGEPSDATVEQKGGQKSEEQSVLPFDH